MIPAAGMVRLCRIPPEQMSQGPVTGGAFVFFGMGSPSTAIGIKFNERRLVPVEPALVEEFSAVPE